MTRANAKVFETFKPENPLVARYVDYYYLDIQPGNRVNEFQCFPHFNNTISVYRSHVWAENGEMQFDESAEPFQIFTPIREKVLHVKQSGRVHRLVLVFYPLGVQQFYREVNFAGYITGFEFFTPDELGKMFSTTDTGRLTRMLDDFLEKRFREFSHPALERSIQYILEKYEKISVTEIAGMLGISRQHLNRVFQAHLGVSAKKFHEIVLFRQTVNKKLFERFSKSYTELAYEFNFSDQPHFNKTYKNLTATSPRSFFNKGTVLGKEDTFWHLHP